MVQLHFGFNSFVYEVGAWLVGRTVRPSQISSGVIKSAFQSNSLLCNSFDSADLARNGSASEFSSFPVCSADSRTTVVSG